MMDYSEYTANRDPKRVAIRCLSCFEEMTSWRTEWENENDEIICSYCGSEMLTLIDPREAEPAE
jgi:DNA-directed RNA polymerase subunit RPC12/RpoP